MSWKSEWLKQTRLEQKLRQADLAKSANCSIRTIQRAERGDKVSDENWLDFEAVLGPLPRFDDQRDAKVALLKRVDSARALFQDLKRAGMAKLGCDAEPTKETIELLKDCVRFLEARLPRPYDFDGGQTYSPTSLADELDDIATFNEQLEKLHSVGVSVYCGVSHHFVQYPHYHPYADSGVGYDDQMVRALHLMVASSVREREPFPDVQSWELPDADVPF